MFRIQGIEGQGAPVSAVGEPLALSWNKSRRPSTGIEGRYDPQKAVAVNTAEHGFYRLDKRRSGPMQKTAKHMMTAGPIELNIPENILDQWQSVVDIVTEIGGLPAGLIMRVVEEEIEVLIASNTEENPYHCGDREPLFGTGLYCETVIKTREPLHIPDASVDSGWKDNPDVKLGMISYLGFPILLPDGNPFGTICVLDRKHNAHSDILQTIMRRFCTLIESHLELLYMNAALGQKNQRLTDYIDEIQALRGLIPICSSCKKIKDSEGYWRSVEKYIAKHPDAHFSHGFCPECADRAMDDMKNLLIVKGSRRGDL